MPSWGKLAACAAVIQILKQSVIWLVAWLYYVSIICAIGAVLGVITHLLFGLFFQDQADYQFLAAFGFLNGLKYGSVWAGGAAIVLCVMRARKQYLLRQSGMEAKDL